VFKIKSCLFVVSVCVFSLTWSAAGTSWWSLLQRRTWPAFSLERWHLVPYLTGETTYSGC